MKESEDGFIVVFCTASPEESESIKAHLILTGLAACVNAFPVTSTYIWQDELCNEPEHLLIIKTHRDRFDELSAAIKKIHSYDLPEIIALPVIAGSEDYFAWMREILQP